MDELRSGEESSESLIIVSAIYKLTFNPHRSSLLSSRAASLQQKLLIMRFVLKAEFPDFCSMLSDERWSFFQQIQYSHVPDQLAIQSETLRKEKFEK